MRTRPSPHSIAFKQGRRNYVYTQVNACKVNIDGPIVSVPDVGPNITTKPGYMSHIDGNDNRYLLESPFT